MHILLLFINTIGMSASVWFSILFGLTGYLYFIFFAIPITSIALFVKIRHDVRFTEIGQILLSAIGYGSISYILFVCSINVDARILQFILFFISTGILSYFITERLPGMISKFTNSKIYFSGYYKTTILTIGTLLLIHTFFTYQGFGDWMLLIGVMGPILFFLTPFIYIHSFEPFPWSLPTRFHKGVFIFCIAVVYILFVYFNLSLFRYPSCC